MLIGQLHQVIIDSKLSKLHLHAMGIMKPGLTLIRQFQMPKLTITSIYGMDV